jgi:hypothetical protein
MILIIVSERPILMARTRGCSTAGGYQLPQARLM